MINPSFFQGVIDRCPNVGMPLTLVFKKDADVRGSMGTLLRLHNDHLLRINQRDMLIVLVMADSGTFDRDENRNVSAHLHSLGQKMLFDQFSSLLNSLETIKLAHDHDLMSLQSGRQKRREEALAQIESAWISNELRDSVNGWSMKLVVALESIEGFHACKISIHDSYGHEFTSVTLDGWSGLMRHRTTWLKERLASAAQLNRLLMTDIDQYLETATAA